MVSRKSAAARYANQARAAQADWRSTLARSGLTAKGVLYAALGILAVQVAAGGSGSETATRRGAVELVASQPLGQWLLALLTIGLFALALWQVVMAFTGDPVEGSEAKDRARYAGKAVIYLGTAITALGMLLPYWGGGGSRAGGSGGSGGSSQDQAAAMVMGWPGGPWLVGIGGLAVIGFAVHQFVQHAWHKKFMQRLDRSEMNGNVGSAVERAGQAGYTARATVLVIIGIFFIVAAVQHDPQEAVGLSGALQAATGRSWGQAVLWTIAIGLFLFGCFTFAEARYRRAT